jgi:hypothetical protein
MPAGALETGSDYSICGEICQTNISIIPNIKCIIKNKRTFNAAGVDSKTQNDQ